MYKNNYATIEESIGRMQKLMGNTAPVVRTEQVLGNIEKVYRGHDNNAYAIVKENSHYYLKVSGKTSDLSLNDFEYLGGNRQCKNLYEYSSFANAEKFLKEHLITLNQQVNNQELLKEEAKRVDTNLEKTATSTAMRSEIDRIREIMENTNRINKGGSASVVKKSLNEKVNIANEESGMITDSVNEEPVNEIISNAIKNVASGIGNMGAGVIHGQTTEGSEEPVNEFVSNAIKNVASGIGNMGAGVIHGQTTEGSEDDELELELDGDDEFDLDDEFDSEEENEFEEDLEDEFDGEEDEEMSMLNALMDKLNSIEEKLDGADSEEGEFEIDLDDDSEGEFDLDECGVVGEGDDIEEAFLSDKLNAKYGTLPKQADEAKANFERVITSWLERDRPGMSPTELANALKAKIDEIVAEEESDDIDNPLFDDPDDRMTGTMGEANMKRMVQKIIKETISTIASDVTKDNFGYTNAEPDSKGRTSFDNPKAEKEIGLGNHHEDTLDQIKSTTGNHSKPSTGSTPAGKVANVIDDIEVEIVDCCESKNKKPLYIVEQDGTVIGKIARETLKKRK